MKMCKECGREYPDNVELCEDDGSRLISVTLSGSKDPLLGKVLDERFEIEARLGQGGMGTVYRARQLSMDRTVAVKILQQHLANEAAAVQRFFREARAASQLQHPNTITTYDFGQSDEGYLYIAMEHLDGNALDKVLDDEGTLGFVEAMEIVHQICGSLVEAHEKGIVHRDLKPENIMLVRVEDHLMAKVLDFGIAKMTDAMSTVTKTGSLLGTPVYMAPEQSKGERVDQKADIYSVGVMLFESVIGHTPFHSLSELEVMLTKIEKPEIDTRDTDEGELVPEPLRQLVLAMTSGDTALRPSAREVQVRIERIIEAFGPEELSGRLSPEKKGTLVPASVGISTPGRVLSRLKMVSQAVTLPDVLPTAAQRRPVWALGIAGGVIAIAAVVLWNPFGRVQTSDTKALRQARELASITDASVASPWDVETRADARPASGVGDSRTQPQAIVRSTPDVVLSTLDAQAEARTARIHDATAPVISKTPAMVTIRVESMPEGARIYRAATRRVIGVTPFDLRMRVDKGKKERLTLSRRGYKRYALQVQFDTNRTYTVSLVKTATIVSKRKKKRKFSTSELK